MTDSASDDEGTMIGLKFKTIQETYELRINQDSNIEKIKRQISKKIEQPEEKICLILSGKILKDHETLTQHKIGDGMVIHMVIKNANKPQSSRESTPSSASSTTGGPIPNMAPSAGSTAAGQGQFGGMLNNPGGMGAMLNNPMVRDMLNSPFMETLMNNPNVTEMMRSMLEQNPQFQQIIQNNPELGHILNDPRVMQQTLEMIRNPNMFNELMRNHDQAVRNLQGIPGGEAALHRLYQEVQEPLMNSVLGTPGTGTQYAPNNNGNAAQQNNAQNANSRSQHAGVENAEALPNPWSRVVNQNQQQQPATGADAANVGGAAGGLPFANMMNTPGMQSLLRQVLSNQNAMQSLMSPENMRQFGEMMGNSQLADQMRTGMANPQMMQAMTNPRVLNAIMQLQQALRVLNEEMPGVFPNIPGMEMFQNMAGLFGGGAGQNSANQPQQQGGAGGEQNVGGGNLAPNAAEGGGAAPPQGLAELLGSIALMNLGNNAPAAPAQPPEERYRTQLEQLTSMGFTDQQANIQALLASYGDLNMAIERLLGGGQPGSG